MHYPGVKINQYGYYEVIEKPTEEELKTYYSEKYFQENKGAYAKKYTEEELTFFKNKNEQKFFIVNTMVENGSGKKRFLDIGCGEGFALSYFIEQNWDVLGLDYSDFGCKEFNSHCLPNLIQGDIYGIIEKLIANHEKFDLLLLDNVLEHVINPAFILEQCAKLLNKKGVLVIEVPNDFSVLQQYLLDKNKIDKPFWVVLPDHLSYFNFKGLNSLLEESGFQNKLTISDYPIDFNLLNDNTNYSRDKSKGKNCHQTRVELENIIHNISIPCAIDLYKAYASLGLGRQIISFNQLT